MPLLARLPRRLLLPVTLGVEVGLAWYLFMCAVRGHHGMAALNGGVAGGYGAVLLRNAHLAKQRRLAAEAARADGQARAPKHVAPGNMTLVVPGYFCWAIGLVAQELHEPPFFTPLAAVLGVVAAVMEQRQAGRSACG